MIGYFDGSDHAYAAVIYLRWALQNGSFDVNLACSKAKVTLLNHKSTPHSELNGAVLLSRFLLFHLKSCDKAGIKASKAWILGDSECTLASTEKTIGALREYFRNRISEILDNQAIGNDGEWWHVP